jgi:diaminohydroxyphosphoribosylaminopyrimidine deaminase/5-amino-6-(5-phosphoribosylamino)uracil reductase
LFAYSDEYYMARAIRLARNGWYTTHPNPRVGCLLVKDGQLLSEGWHEYAGQGHAEVNALAALENIEQARGATAYVTLEPCSHFGKTPPCSIALIEAGIARVVIGMVDPNPLVAGNGVKRLQEQGIEVKTGVLEAEVSALNSGFIQRMLHKRPRIRCKMAMSLDGRTAMASGESQWITGPEAREDVQRLRAESSAIMTGIGTVLADDPSMNVRSEHYQQVNRQPDRVILDSRLQLPLTAKMLGLSGQTCVCTAKASQKTNQRDEAGQAADKQTRLTELGVAVYQLASDSVNAQPRIRLAEVMNVLNDRQYNEVLLEAGAKLTGAMLQAGYVDELIIYMAPHLMGSEARGLFNLPGLDKMQDRIELSITDIRAVGKDFRISAMIQQ